MSRKKKKNRTKKLLKLTVATCLLLTISYLALDFCSGLGLSHKVRVSEDWKLIVVNRWNKLPEDYRIELTELSNGEKVDSRIYPALQEMFDAARAEKVYPIVRDGYRSMEEQQKEITLYDVILIEKSILYTYFAHKKTDFRPPLLNFQILVLWYTKSNYYSF